MTRTAPAPRRSAVAFLVALALGVATGPLAAGDLPGGSIQAAIDAASPGDVIEVPAGEYVENLDFLGKAVTVRGVGPHTVIRGNPGAPVVVFGTGEGPDSVLDSVTITGGEAPEGGGVWIDDCSPTVVRCTITGNRADSRGSGIMVRGAGAAPRLYNNVVSYNTRNGSGDPHGIQVSGGAPLIVNNTIVRGDSNGILLSGGTEAVVLNNVIAWNGAKVGKEQRGRGICDFSGGSSVLRNNVFHANRVAAILRGGKDWSKIRKFEKKNPDADVVDNVDGNPGYVRKPPKDPAKASCLDLTVCDALKGRAIDAGHDDEACEDLDGSRNTAGHTGGPYAAGRALPDGSACGVLTGR